MMWRACQDEKVSVRTGGADKTTYRGLKPLRRDQPEALKRELGSRRYAPRQTFELDDRTDLHGALLRPAGGDGDHLSEISGVDQKIAAELFSCLGKRAVGDEALALTDPDAGRRRGRLRGRCGDALPGRVELVCELCGFVVTATRSASSSACSSR
jgi:hypothetical protein